MASISAKGSIVSGGEAVVVEGYTDVIAFDLADKPVAVATCGTALGEEHLDLLASLHGAGRFWLLTPTRPEQGAALRGFRAVGSRVISIFASRRCRPGGIPLIWSTTAT